MGDFRDELDFRVKGLIRSSSLRVGNLPTLIVSSERFSDRLSTVSQLVELRDSLHQHANKIKILCYVREQQELALSRYSQALKFGSTLPLDQYLNKINPESLLYNHWKLANLWTSVFGKENVIFRAYKSKQSTDYDVNSDFIDALAKMNSEINASRLRFPEVKNNLSLSVTSASATRALNEIEKSQENSKRKLFGKKTRYQTVRNALEQLEFFDLGQLSNPLPNELRVEFKETNRKFFQEYLPGEGFVNESQDKVAPILTLETLDDVVFETTKQILLASHDRPSRKKKRRRRT